MIEVTILIPVADNDGHEFSADHHRAFESFLLETFGGFSRLPGLVRGAWLGDGIRYDDELIVYLVAIQSIADGGNIGGAASFAKVHYRQEAIFLRYLGQAEII